MENLIASGRLAEFIAALVLAEFAALAFLRWRTGRGPPLVALAGTLGAGFCLVMALRAALAGQGWQPIALWLTGALVAHAVDLYARLRA